MHQKYSSIGIGFFIVLLTMLPACSTQTPQTINTQIRTEWNQLNQDLAKKKRALTDREKEVVKQVVMAHYHLKIQAKNLLRTGRVVDINGKPLEGVFVRASYDRSSQYAPKSDTVETRTKTDADGYYRVWFITFIHTVNYRWHLNGYYGRSTHRWTRFTSEQVITSLESGDTIPELNHFVNGAAVTLVPHGTLTELDKRKGELLFSPHGPLTVFRYQRKDNVKKHLAQAAKYGTGFFEIKQKSPAKNKKNLPEKGFYIELPINEDGTIKTTMLTNPLNKNDHTPRPHVSWLRIHAVGKGYGLQLAMKPGEPVGPNMYRFKEAPVDGYKQVVELSSKYLATQTGYSKLWFYVKVNDKYGRMNLVRFRKQLRAKNKPQEYFAITEFQVQPDGSRNLEMGN